MITHVIAAIDMALWDITGKLWGVPVYRLLGGPCRDKIRMYPTPKAHKAGTGGPHPLSGDPRDIKQLVSMVENARKQVGPDGCVMFDAHCAIPPATLIQFANAIEPYNILFLEEPCVPGNIDAFMRLKQQIRIPMAAGVSRWMKSTNGRRISSSVSQPSTVVQDGLSRTKCPLKDAAQISFNHEFHLEPGVRGVDELSAGPEARGVTKTPAGDRLNCGYCHQPDDSQAYMAPVRFAKHCVACHALDFDPRLPSAVVPHDTPRMVRAFLRDFFATAAEECRKPGALQDGAATELRRRCQTIGLVKGDDRPDDGAAAEPWIATQLTTVFKQNCSFCHRVSVAPGRLPEVAATAIPTRWFPHSRFDHRPHRVLGCIECHQTARSRETTDVLLPSIKTCRDCHRQGADAARSSCVECHYYHEKALERNQDGPFAIRDLRQRRLDPGRREP